MYAKKLRVYAILFLEDMPEKILEDSSSDILEDMPEVILQDTSSDILIEPSNTTSKAILQKHGPKSKRRFTREEDDDKDFDLLSYK